MSKLEEYRNDFSLIDGCFMEFLELCGSRRLVNAVSASLSSNLLFNIDFPYKTYKEMMSDNRKNRINKLVRIPNLGRKAVDQYLDCIDSFLSKKGDEFLVKRNKVARVDTKEDIDFSLIQGEFINFIEKRGSVRLSNCIKSSIKNNTFPFDFYSDYINYHTDNVLVKLLKINNLGKKTAYEYINLVKDFIDYNAGLLRSPGQDHKSIEQNVDDIFDLDNLFSLLKDKERFVIERRYGILPSKLMTLEELGKELSVTRERVRQIQQRAIQRLSADKEIWRLYLQKHNNEVINAIFKDKYAVSSINKISGILFLAIVISDKTIKKYVSRLLVEFKGYWLHPKLDAVDVKDTYKALQKYLHANKVDIVPILLSEISTILNRKIVDLKASLTILKDYSLYKGYIVDGRLFPRKKRTVNILYLYDNDTVLSPCTLWDIKRVYWSKFLDDKCTGRDLIICMEEYPAHFINLHGLGWMRLHRGTPYVRKNIKKQNNINVSHERLRDLYAEPVSSGSAGLPNQVYRMFKQEGPMKLGDAANRFAELYPQYAQSSIYPMLIIYAVFIRMAPGIVGIQSHMNNELDIKQAREYMLDIKQIDLYMLAKISSPPLIHYPLWDSSMEHQWCQWLFNEENHKKRLGQLLTCVDVEAWKIESREQEWWAKYKKQHAIPVIEPTMPNLDNHLIPMDAFVIVLAAAEISGISNWMQANQALGWRVETRRVASLLAILIHMGAFQSGNQWFGPHALTEKGREILNDLLSDRVKSNDNVQNTLIESDIEDLGWAKKFTFEELINKVNIKDRHIGNDIHHEDDDAIDLDDFYSEISIQRLNNMIDNESE